MTDMDSKRATTKLSAYLPRWSVSLAEFLVFVFPAIVTRPKSTYFGARSIAVAARSHRLKSAPGGCTLDKISHPEDVFVPSFCRL